MCARTTFRLIFESCFFSPLLILQSIRQRCYKSTVPLQGTAICITKPTSDIHQILLPPNTWLLSEPDFSEAESFAISLSSTNYRENQGTIVVVNVFCNTTAEWYTPLSFQTESDIRYTSVGVPAGSAAVSKRYA